MLLLAVQIERGLRTRDMWLPMRATARPPASDRRPYSHYYLGT
jgi:hypothetical protein